MIQTESGLLTGREIHYPVYFIRAVHLPGSYNPALYHPRSKIYAFELAATILWQ